MSMEMHVHKSIVSWVHGNSTTGLTINPIIGRRTVDYSAHPDMRGELEKRHTKSTTY